MFRYTRIVCSERLIGRPKMLFYETKSLNDLAHTPSKYVFYES